jgi:hypothetical protein
MIMMIIIHSSSSSSGGGDVSGSRSGSGSFGSTAA